MEAIFKRSGPASLLASPVTDSLICPVTPVSGILRPFHLDPSQGFAIGECPVTEPIQNYVLEKGYIPPLVISISGHEVRSIPASALRTITSCLAAICRVMLRPVICSYRAAIWVGLLGASMREQSHKA